MSAFSENDLEARDFFISGRRECTTGLESPSQTENIPGTCLYKSDIAGYRIGEKFDDYEDLNLGMLEPPLTKMVFWRYTCAKPCLGTEDIPGRNGHVTSFMAKYDSVRSGFHGFPLLGGTRTAMRTFFNFTNRDDGLLENETAAERIRKVEVDLSAPPWGAVSMIKLSTSNDRDEINDENFHYVGFIKWYHSGFLALNPPDAFPHLKWHVRAFHGYIDKAGFINGMGVYWAPDSGCEEVLQFNAPKTSTTLPPTTFVDERVFETEPTTTAIFTTEETQTTTANLLPSSIEEPSKTTTSISSTESTSTQTLPKEFNGLVNQAAVSLASDGCLVESQADYEFQRCQLDGVVINTREDGYGRNMANFKFPPKTKCRVIKCRAEFGGPWTRNMHCKCDTFGCRWISMKFQSDKAGLSPRTFWDRPKEIQNQSPEPVLTICHKGCPALNEDIFDVKRYKIMKSKFREKFGTDYKNLTSSTGESLYPVKTLVTSGRCKKGKRKGELIFKRAKCSCGAWKYASLRENWEECKTLCKNGVCQGKCEKDVYACRWAIWKDAAGNDPFANDEIFDEWVDNDRCT